MVRWSPITDRMVSTPTTSASGLPRVVCAPTRRSGSSSSRRVDSPLDRDITKKDHYRAVDPGFEIGGPILKDRLWLFTSYILSFTRLTSTVTLLGSDSNV